MIHQLVRSAANQPKKESPFLVYVSKIPLPAGKRFVGQDFVTVYASDYRKAAIKLLNLVKLPPTKDYDVTALVAKAGCKKHPNGLPMWVHHIDFTMA